MDELLEQFLIEARELIAQAADDFGHLERDPADRPRIDSAFRAIHTLKGSVVVFDMVPAERALHAAEDLLERARAGTHALDGEGLAALVAILDETDRWVDAMERAGALPASATATAERLVARISGVELAPTVAATPIAGGEPAWLETLRAREAERIAAAGTDLVAFRYTPDPDCFFRGDDPLGIIAGVPDLVGFALLPSEPWPELDAFEPFRCAVILEGLSAAPLAQVRAALRLVGDQVETAEIHARLAEQEEIGIAGAQKSLRVDSERIDALADGVGELIVVANMLSHVAGEADRIDPRIGARVHAAHAELERAVGDMRRAVMAVRMVSLAPSLRRLPRMIREIAETLEKPVSFEMRGEATEVDKGVADAIYEPLLHIVRNALDHGIEPAPARHAAGKSETATLRLDVRRDADHVVITVSDDGAGIDPAHIRTAAVARGIVEREAADAMDDTHAIRLIFAAGFSTAAQVTAVSGRGVGLDAVKSAIEQLGGGIDIASTLGSGTSFRLRLPLNAIMTRLLIVRVGEDRYGVPLDRIVETASVPSDHILAVGAGQACVLRDRTLPILDLARLLGAESTRAPLTKLLVTEASAEPVGVIVDGFGERIDGLVRPRSGLLAGVPGVAGTTLLGDGGVLLVLDLAELVA
jgi:two-component system chemotaxis sensor kinase CheA